MGTSDLPTEIYEAVKRWQSTSGRFEYELTGAVGCGESSATDPPTRSILFWLPPRFRVDDFEGTTGRLFSQEFFNGSRKFICASSIEACRRLSAYESGKSPTPTFAGDLLRPRKLLYGLRKHDAKGRLQPIRETWDSEECVGYRLADEGGSREVVFGALTGMVVRIDWFTQSHEGHVTLKSRSTEVADEDFRLPYPVVRSWQWNALADSVHAQRDSELRRHLRIADRDNDSQE